MAKPLVTAKHPSPNWTIWYLDNDTGEQTSMQVIGSPTIDDALAEAKQSLDALHRDYTIMRIELVSV
jgi:hypothetical protein